MACSQSAPLLSPGKLCPSQSLLQRQANLGWCQWPPSAPMERRGLSRDPLSSLTGCVALLPPWATVSWETLLCTWLSYPQRFSHMLLGSLFLSRPARPLGHPSSGSVYGFLPTAWGQNWASWGHAAENKWLRLNNQCSDTGCIALLGLQGRIRQQRPLLCRAGLAWHIRPKP